MLLVLALLALPTASDGADRVGPSCHGASDVELSMAAAVRQVDWNCTTADWADGREVIWLRFDHWNRKDPPKLFTARMTVFDSVAVAALDDDGSVRSLNYDSSEAVPLLAGPVFGVELPEVKAGTRAFVARIVRPHSLTVASEATLRGRPLSGVSPASLMLLSIVAGMLIMPLMFDIMYFLVLRERFVLLHAGLLLSMLVYVSCGGGIITAFVVLPVKVLAIGGPLAFAIGTAFAGCFIAAFIEQGILPGSMRRLLDRSAIFVAVCAGLCALQLDATQAFDNRLYFLCFLPLLPVYLITIGVAVWRGSRGARYLAFAFAPIIATAFERLLRGIGAYAAPASIDHAMFVAMGLEVIIVTLGVADRFLSIRRERDQALDSAETLRLLSERDALTGLFNRRVIEERFSQLRQEGFTALAVIDLDHFKRVNDTYGHATGDVVLKLVGRTLLSQDEDTIAFRVGGEEFLLMLRGSDAVQRAENRRQEIARAVAQEDLGCLVTASLGIVEVTGGALPGASFATIYARADRLLYQAKAAGRNRLVYERIKAFQPRRGDRRAAA